MVEDSNSSSKLMNMDELLKFNLVNFWFDAIRLNVNGEWFKCFLAYKSIFEMIQPYNFNTKSYTSELINVLNSYFNSLGSKPVNMKDMVELNNRKATFREMLDQLTSLLPRAFVDLNIWFKSISETNDYDVKLSNDNFGDDLTLIEKKRKALLTLSKEDMIKLFSINSVHDAFVRGLNQNVL